MSRSAFIKSISLALSLNFILSPFAFTVSVAMADDGILPAVQNTAMIAQQAVTQIGVSQMQVQSMVNQMAMYSQAAGNFNPYQGTFAQTSQQLGMAYAQMQQCTAQQIQGVDQKTKVLKGKNNNMSAIAIENTEPTCSNSLDIRESVKRLSLQFDALSAETGNCMGAFKRNVDSVIENVKKPFDQLTTAATQQAQIYDQLIGGYDKAYTKIQNDLEGDNGYRAQLKGLQDLKQQMNDVLNKGTGDANSPAGLNRRLTALQRQRHGVATAWMNSIMNQTLSSCFQGDSSMPCEADGTPAPPAACLLRQVSNLNGGTQQGSANYNQKILQNVFTQQFGAMRQAFLASNTDINDVASFIAEATGRFTTVNQQAANILSSAAFRGSIDQAQVQGMVSFYTNSMNQCFTTTMNQFKASIASCYNTSGANNASTPDAAAATSCASNGYSDPLIGVQEEEQNILNDANKVIEDATTRMNSFRTNFTKVFNNDLSQFKSNCAASNSAYQAVTCLNTVNKILDNGLNGTNGEAPTTMNVNTVQVVNGVPQQGSRSFQCVGFNDCLNVLGKARDFNRDQRDSQTDAKKQFAISNNKTVDAAFGAIAQQFTMNGQLMNQQVTAINAALKALGVETTLETKPVDGEALTIDDKSGLYQMPKSMKAALANKTGFMDLDPDNLKEVQSSISHRKIELAKKGAKAAEMLGKCEVKDSDYASISAKLTHCEDAESVCSNRTGLLTTMEALVNKSLNKLSDENKVTDNLRDCLQQSRSSSEFSTSDYLKVDPSKEQQAVSIMKLKEAKASKETGYCLDNAKADLDQMNLKNARSSDLKNNNSSLLSGIGDINLYCRKMDAGDTSVASSISNACTSLQSSAKSMKAPVDETADDESSTDDVSNPEREKKARKAD